MKIEMVDLKGQYIKIKEEINSEIRQVLNDAQFIGGAQVKEFSSELARYMTAGNVITCANGTDALQIALMALNLERGDEVILPAFTYAATAEVVALLGLVPVLADVSPYSFNIEPTNLSQLITEKTKVIMPVHLYGQSAEMESLLDLAKEYGLKVVEDNAQAIGADYTFSSGKSKRCGTIGDIGCTSFFPSKNLGCYGDGGAIFTDDDELAERLRMIANHGQRLKYKHDIVGCNSRLDTIQAAILRIKLSYLDSYTAARRGASKLYRELLSDIEEVMLPVESQRSTHVYHQFTIRCQRRDELKEFLHNKGVPSMVYYPIPIHRQRAFSDIAAIRGDLSVAERLCEEVLSLPMHTELTADQQGYIADNIRKFYR
jgi:dTDP-4-amino-4,6-dideoxygalactose transaminase